MMGRRLCVSVSCHGMSTRRRHSWIFPARRPRRIPSPPEPTKSPFALLSSRRRFIFARLEHVERWVFRSGWGGENGFFRRRTVFRVFIRPGFLGRCQRRDTIENDHDLSNECVVAVGVAGVFYLPTTLLVTNSRERSAMLFSGLTQCERSAILLFSYLLQSAPLKTDKRIFS